MVATDHSAADRVAAQPGEAQRLLAQLGRQFAIRGRLIVAALAGGLGVLAVPVDQITATSAAAVAAVLWSVGVAYWGRRSGSGWLLAADVAVVSALGLTQVWTVPPSAIDNPGSGWAVTLISFCAVAYQWLTPAWLGWLAGGTVATAAFVGTLAGLILGGHPLSVDPLQGTAWILAEVGLSRLLWRLVNRGGHRADAARAGAEQARRRAAVAAARRADERHHAALLHDTAATTLLMVGLAEVPASSPWLGPQARRDLRALDTSVDDHEGSAPGPTTDVEIDAALANVVAEVPLDVTVARLDHVRVPAPVAAAVCGAVAEALSNVHRHAGTTAATLTSTWTDGCLVVEVRDEGRGFEPHTVSDTRRGIAHSITARMAGIDGTAVVSSQPGRGTGVRLAWRRA